MKINYGFLKYYRSLILVISMILVLLSVVQSKNFLFEASNLKNLKKLAVKTRSFAPSQDDILHQLSHMNITVCPGNKNATIVNNTLICSNSQGKTISREVPVVNKAPYYVKSCDQVLYISDAQRIINYDDCNSREPAFFTMSFYMVNFFSKNDSSTLKQSILINDMTTLPSYIPGTNKKCLSFENGKTTEKGFGICFKDSKDTESLFESFMSFMKCRMGDNLKVLSLSQLKKVYQLSCAGLPIDPKLVFSNNKDDIIKRINKNVQINPYYNHKIPPGGMEKKTFNPGFKNFFGK